MIHDGGVAFHNTVHREVAPVACIGNLSVLKRLNGSLDSINGGTAIVHDQHGEHCGAVVKLVIAGRALGAMHSLIASFKMNLLILMTVVSCARVDIDATHIFVERTTRDLPYVRLVRIGAVCGRTLVARYRHALGCGEAPSEFSEPRADRVQLQGGISGVGVS
jgi:hypothetical protein